MDPDVKSKSIK